VPEFDSSHTALDVRKNAAQSPVCPHFEILI
jgi:hypothetical protein